MAKAQYDMYLSKQTKNHGEMGEVIFKGNQITPFRLDDCVWLVYSKKRYSERELIERLEKAILEVKARHSSQA